MHTIVMHWLALVGLRIFDSAVAHPIKPGGQLGASSLIRACRMKYRFGQ